MAVQRWFALVVILCTAVAGVSAVTGRGGLCLSLVVVLFAVAISGPGRSPVSCLPTAALLTSASLVAWLVATQTLGLQLLGTPARSRTTLAVLAAVASAAALRSLRPGLQSGQPSHVAGRAELVVCLPAVIILLLGAWSGGEDLPRAVGGFLHGWDNGAHVLYSAEVARAGELDYDTRPYPRGLHALVAVLVSVRAPVDATPESLEMLLRVQSGITWTLFALFAAAVALTTLELARRFVPRQPATVVGLAAGALTLSPFVFSFVMQYGFETTLLAALVLQTLALELVRARTGDSRVLVPVAAVVLTAHTYQLLVPAAAVPTLLVVCELVRRRPPGWRRLVVISGVALLAAVPPVWAVARDTGLEAVATPGAAAHLPVIWVVAAALSALWISRRGEPVLGVMVMSVVAVAVVSAWLTGTSVTSYYPRKLLWHAATLALPLIALGAALLLRSWATRASSLGKVLGGSSAGTLFVVVAALSVPGPYLAVSGGWDLMGDVVGVIMEPDRKDRICALRSEYSRQVAHRLLSFYGGEEPAVGALPPCPEAPERDSSGPREVPRPRS